MFVQDKRGRGLPALEAATQELAKAANATPGFVGVFSLFNTRTPKVYADIDRVKAQMLGVTSDRVFDALQTYLGSAYINDFNYLGRTYQVTAQADGRFREDQQDIANLKREHSKSWGADRVGLGSELMGRGWAGAKAGVAGEAGCGAAAWGDDGNRDCPHRAR